MWLVFPSSLVTSLLRLVIITSLRAERRLQNFILRIFIIFIQSSISRNLALIPHKSRPHTDPNTGSLTHATTRRMPPPRANARYPTSRTARITSHVTHVKPYNWRRRCRGTKHTPLSQQTTPSLQHGARMTWTRAHLQLLASQSLARTDNDSQSRWTRTTANACG